LLWIQAEDTLPSGHFSHYSSKDFQDIKKKWLSPSYHARWTESIMSLLPICFNLSLRITSGQCKDSASSSWMDVARGRRSKTALKFFRGGCALEDTSGDLGRNGDRTFSAAFVVAAFPFFLLRTKEKIESIEGYPNYRSMKRIYNHLSVPNESSFGVAVRS